MAGYISILVLSGLSSVVFYRAHRKSGSEPRPARLRAAGETFFTLLFAALGYSGNLRRSVDVVLTLGEAPFLVGFVIHMVRWRATKDRSGALWFHVKPPVWERVVLVLLLVAGPFMAWEIAEDWGRGRSFAAVVAFLGLLEGLLEGWNGVQFREKGILRVMDFTPWTELKGWTLEPSRRRRKMSVVFQHRGRPPLQQLVYDHTHFFEGSYGIPVPRDRIDALEAVLRRERPTGTQPS